MDPQLPPLTPAEEAELAELLASIQGGINSPDVPQNIQELLRNVKRQKGDKTVDPEGEELIPEPGFVVKALDTEKRKVFLNVCSSPKVDPPAGLSNGQLPEEMLQALDKLDSAGEDKLNANELESLRIPLSCGNPRADKDNKGEACTIVDVVFNADVVKQAAVARALKYFIIQIAMNWVAQKFGTQLDPKYKLPKMKYKGDKVQPQMMRKPKKSLVKDMGEVPEDPVFPLVTKKLPPKQTPLLQASNSGQQPAQPPAVASTTSTSSTAAGRISMQKPGQPAGAQQTAKHKLAHHITFGGKPVETMIVEVPLPDWPQEQSNPSISIECHPQQLTVSVSRCSTLEVTLPFAARSEGSTAVVEAGTLKVQLPVRPLQELVEELRRAAPHTPGSLQLANSDCYELD